MMAPERIGLGAALLALAACAAPAAAPPEPLVAADPGLVTATVQQALEHDRAGESRAWAHEASGQRGAVTPMRTYRLADGRPCREYRSTVRVGNLTQVAYGEACRAESGIWLPSAPLPYVAESASGRAAVLAERRQRLADIDPYTHLGYPFDPFFGNYYPDRHESGVALHFSFGY